MIPNIHRLLALALLTLPAMALAADVEHPEGEHAARGVMDFQIGSAFFTLVLFVLLLVVLGLFVWPKVLQALNARDQKIRSDIAGAEAANKQAQQTLADYQRQLAEAHADARKLVEQSRVDAEAVRQRIVAETEAEAARLRKRAAEEIEQAKNAATQELYAKASELSVAVAEKILQRQITEADTQRLIDQSLAELDKVSPRAS